MSRSTLYLSRGECKPEYFEVRGLLLTSLCAHHALAGIEVRFCCSRHVTSSGNEKYYFAQGPLIPEAFSRAAAAHPNKICLVSAVLGDRSMTFSEVDTAARSLAHRLVQRGISADAAVAILLDRSFEVVIAMIAVLKVR